MNNKTKQGGLGIVSVLTLIFIVLKLLGVIKASPRNARVAHLLASFPSYFTKILVCSSTTACEFLFHLTKNLTAQLHHRNYAVKP